MAKPNADLLGKAMTWWLRVSWTGVPISRREVAVAWGEEHRMGARKAREDGL